MKNILEKSKGRPVIRRCLFLLFFLLFFSQFLFPRDGLIFLVLPFNSDSNRGSYDREVTSRIEGTLGRIMRFTLADRSSVEQVIVEQQFQMSGIVNESTVVRIGQIVGANKAITGYYIIDFERVRTNSGSFLQANLLLNIKIIDIESGRVDIALPEIKRNGSDSGNRDIAFHNALDKALKVLDHEIRSFYALHSTVYKREGDVVILADGSRAGIQVGHYFSVMKNYSFEDPATGETFLLNQEEVGILRIERVEEEFSYAAIIEGRYKIREGMVIEENPAYFEKATSLSAYYVSTVSNPDNLPAGGLISGGSIYGRTEILDNLNTGLGMDILFAGPVSVFNVFGCLGVDVPVIPEIFTLTLDGRLGILFASQEGINIHAYIDEQNYNVRSTRPAASVFLAGINLGGQLQMPGNFIFELQAGYLFAPSISNWELTEDRKEDAEVWNIPGEYLKQPVFDPAGIQISIGFSYKGFKALF